MFLLLDLINIDEISLIKIPRHHPYVRVLKNRDITSEEISRDSRCFSSFYLHNRVEVRRIAIIILPCLQIGHPHPINGVTSLARA